MTCSATVALHSLRFCCLGLLCRDSRASCTRQVRPLMCTDLNVPSCIKCALAVSMVMGPRKNLCALVAGF